MFLLEKEDSNKPYIHHTFPSNIHKPSKNYKQVAFHLASPHCTLLTALVAFTNAPNSHAPVVLSNADAGQRGERLFARYAGLLDAFYR